MKTAFGVTTLFEKEAFQVPEVIVPTVASAEAEVRLPRVSIADSIVASVVASRASMFWIVRVPAASENGTEAPTWIPVLAKMAVPVKVGEALKTTEPVPVSSVRAAKTLAEVSPPVSRAATPAVYVKKP